MGKSGVQAGDLLLLMAQNLDVLAGYIFIRFLTLLFSLFFTFFIMLFVLCLFSVRYASIRAIETRNVVDDQQWLTYWVLYSMITLFELTFEKLIEWIPYWSYVKLVTTCWLVIPQFSGAAYVYQHYIRPFYIRNVTIDVPNTFKKDVFTPAQDVFTPTQDDILFADHRDYVQQSGADGYPDIFQSGLQSDIIDGEVKYRGNTFFSEDPDYVY
ncbi:hypothetical protein SSX86_008840 [Deinandra increscens subsp. villosa]|uniref:HVA22-like protein n=1 Tax=Deinandra increscens subsp. villosa TaxID=3103831 RepID=A0AAP0H514_9ASTR